MITVSYFWHHFKTGKNGISSQEFLSLAEFQTQLNRWNKDDRWLYTYKDHEKK